MPRWEVHLSFGLMAFIVIISAALLGIGDPREIILEREGLTTAFLVLVLGGCALILGSIIPDIDGNGRIKWIIGPIAGAFIFTPPFIRSMKVEGASGGIRFMEGNGSMVFLIATIGAYMLLLLPMKHRGVWHRPGTGLIFGMFWGSYVFLSGALDPGSCIIVGSMATLGYWWHLALDGRPVIEIIPL